MNAKQLAAAVAVALVGTSAMAFEATEFVDPPSTLSRAGVAAVQAAQLPASGAAVVSRGEATQFADVPSIRDRNDVRAEARAAGRQHAFSSLYVGG